MVSNIQENVILSVGYFHERLEMSHNFVAFEKIDANPDTMRFTLSTSVSRETIKHYHLVKEFSVWLGV